VFTIDSLPVMLKAIFPEISILLLVLIVFILDLILNKDKATNLAWVTSIGLLIIVFVSLLIATPESSPSMLWGGMLRFDWLGFVFKMVFMIAAAITALLVKELDSLGNRGEFYLLLLTSLIGMSLMASASDLIMLYLAFETTSIPLYILAGFLKRDDKSTEAGFKYLLFGAMTSAIMLYGFSLIYGLTGTTNLYGISLAIVDGNFAVGTLLGILLLVLIGFGFKISVVPLHFWAPDVYEGAPAPVAGFLSTASKAAGFAVLMRVLITIFLSISANWYILIAILATVTMTLGNLLALAQKNIKRLLAYSSIAHAGYILIGVASISALGITSVVFYLIVYLATNLLAFGVVTAFGKVSGSDEIAAYAGLSRRSPLIAIILLVAFLSLAGMPPFGGFVVKFIIFAAAVQSDMIWLAVVGVLNSIIGLYYYLTVLKVVYLYRSEEEEKPVPLYRSQLLVFAVLTVMIIVLGVVVAPFYDLSNVAAIALAR
jgi:NADH-quinone oxidoreductase subunit N